MSVAASTICLDAAFILVLAPGPSRNAVVFSGRFYQILFELRRDHLLRLVLSCLVLLPFAAHIRAV